MSFEFTVLSDDRFIEILDAWVDSPWPKPPKTATPYATASDGHRRKGSPTSLLALLS